MTYKLLPEISNSEANQKSYGFIIINFLFFVESMQCLKRICEFKTDFISSFVIKYNFLFCHSHNKSTVAQAT
jgi:hypothetical protein